MDLRFQSYKTIKNHLHKAMLIIFVDVMLFMVGLLVFDFPTICMVVVGIIGVIDIIDRFITMSKCANALNTKDRVLNCHKWGKTRPETLEKWKSGYGPQRQNFKVR